MNRTVVSAVVFDDVLFVVCNDGTVFTKSGKGHVWSESSLAIPGTAAAAKYPNESSTNGRY